MKFIKQTQILEVNNIILENDKTVEHGIFLPNTVCCIVCGPLNCVEFVIKHSSIAN